MQPMELPAARTVEHATAREQVLQQVREPGQQSAPGEGGASLGVTLFRPQPRITLQLVPVLAGTARGVVLDPRVRLSA